MSGYDIAGFVTGVINVAGRAQRPWHCRVLPLTSALSVASLVMCVIGARPWRRRLPAAA